MITKHKSIVFVLCSLFFLTAVTGCSKQEASARALERAQAHFKAGDYDRAEIEYLKLLQLEPTNHVAIRTLGIMAREQGRLPRAFAILNQLKAMDPDDLEVRLNLGLCLAMSGAREGREEVAFVLDQQPTNAKALWLLADMSLTPEEIADVQQRLDKFRSAAGTTADYYLARGSLALRNRDLDAAETSFKQALGLSPDSSEAHAAMGNLLLVRENRAGAETEFKAAAALAAPRSPQRMRYADFLLSSGNTNAALQSLEEVTKLAPDYLPALLRQAELALAANELEKSENLLKLVLRRDEANLDAMLNMARVRMAEGDGVKALAEIDRAIKQYPRLPQLQYRKALVSLGVNDVPGAMASLDQALALQPDYTEAILLQAEVNIRRGNMGPVVTSLTALLNREPGLVGAQLMLAIAHRARGNLDEALRIVEAVSRAMPANPEPVLLAGLIQRQQGRSNDARRSFERLLELSPESLPALEQLVAMDVSEKRFEAARTRLEKALEQQSSRAPSQVLLAQVYLAETNQPAAEALLLKAIELEPSLQSAQQLLAGIYVASGRYEDALAEFQKAVARNPDDVATWARIAYFHSAVSNHVAAAEAYETVIARDPRSRIALNNLAVLYAEQLQKLDRAHELASQARAAYPDDPYISDTLGWISYLRGEYGRALPLLQQSVARLPEESEVLFHLGMTQYMLGEDAAARAALQGALQLGREAPWRGKAEARLEVLAWDPATAGGAAIEQLKRWLAERPGDPPLLMRLAALHEREGQWSQAAAAYETVLTLNPDLVSALVQLARINALHLNKTQEAFDLARKARRLAPGDPVVAHTLGRLVFQGADYAWAHSLLHESSLKLPNDPEVQFDYAWSAYSLGFVNNAVNAMQRVVQSVPAAPGSAQAADFLKLTALPGNRAQAEAQVAEIRQRLEADPQDVPALMVMGMLQENQGEFRAAADTYERILKRYPRFSPALTPLARLTFERLRDTNTAYGYAIRAREAFPQDAQVARMLGFIEYERGAHARVVQLLAEIAVQSPNDAEVLYRLGLAQHKLGRQPQSKAALTQALKLAPDAPLAPEAKQILAESN